MADVPLPKEKWTGSIGELELGNSQDKGGSRRSVRLGGNRGMPFLSFEDGERRMIAMAGLVADSLEEVPQPVRDAFGDDAKDPVRWARTWAARGADLICLHLTSTNPEEGDASPESAADTVMAVLKAVDLPLIVYGSGHEEKDSNENIPPVIGFIQKAVENFGKDGEEKDNGENTNSDNEHWM